MPFGFDPSVSDDLPFGGLLQQAAATQPAPSPIPDNDPEVPVAGRDGTWSVKKLNKLYPGDDVPDHIPDEDEIRSAQQKGVGSPPSGSEAAPSPAQAATAYPPAFAGGLLGGRQPNAFSMDMGGSPWSAGASGGKPVDPQPPAQTGAASPVGRVDPTKPADQPGFFDGIKGALGNVSPDTWNKLSAFGFGLAGGRNWGEGISKGGEAATRAAALGQANGLAQSRFAIEQQKSKQQQAAVLGNVQLYRKYFPDAPIEQALAAAQNTTIMTDLQKRGLPSSEQYRTFTDEQGNLVQENTANHQRTMMQQAPQPVQFTKTNQDGTTQDGFVNPRDPNSFTPVGAADKPDESSEHYRLVEQPDAMGVKRTVGKLNINTGKVEALSDAEKASIGSGQPSDVAAQPSPDLHGAEFIKTLDPKIAGQVQAIVDGRAPYPTGQLLKTPFGQQLATYVTQADPGFETGNATSRVKVRSEFNSGGPSSPAGMITAGNTAIQHLGHLSDAAEEVDNGQIPAWNWLANHASQAAGGGTAVTKFNNILGKYVEEATKFYRGTGGTEADIQRDLGNLSPNMSPDQLRTALQTQVDLLQSKINALQDRWKQGMGPLVSDFPIIQPDSQASLDRIAKRAGIAPHNSTGATPDGATPPAQPAPAPAPAPGPVRSPVTIDPSAAEQELRRRGVIR